VAADEVYGADPGLRADLETRQVGYVLAIGCDRRVPTAAGPIRPDTLAESLPKGAWQRLSAGPGAKGQRYYNWASPDSAGRHEGRLTSLSVLVRGSSCCVAGQGFEPWKASATDLQSAASAAPRQGVRTSKHPVCPPIGGSNSQQLRSLGRSVSTSW
jgi:hypothetical protein